MATGGRSSSRIDERWGLPAVDLSLQATLPKLLPPVLGRLCDAVADDDPDPELLDAAARAIDAPTERARAVIAQAKAGRIDDELANAALIELASESRRLLRASLLAFGRRYREVARPFEWTFSRADLERVLDRVNGGPAEPAEPDGAGAPLRLVA